MVKTAREKYLSKPFLGSSHLWAQEQCKSLPAECTVLDVGPGSGVMGQYLLEKGLKELYAVEIDEEAREHAKTIYKEAVADISTFAGKKFDLILLLDVIEHMTTPADFLDQLQGLLNPGGKILISVPNIAHWSVRLPLLFGIFEYTERGILDRTHYQFFTRKRLRQIIEKLPAITLREFDSTIEPIQFLLPKIVWDNPVFELLSKARLALARILPGFFAYQILAVVESKK